MELENNASILNANTITKPPAHKDYWWLYVGLIGSFVITTLLNFSFWPASSPLLAVPAGALFALAMLGFASFMLGLAPLIWKYGKDDPATTNYLNANQKKLAILFLLALIAVGFLLYAMGASSAFTNIGLGTGVNLASALTFGFFISLPLLFFSYLAIFTWGKEAAPQDSASLKPITSTTDIKLLELTTDSHRNQIQLFIANSKNYRALIARFMPKKNEQLSAEPLTLDGAKVIAANLLGFSNELAKYIDSLSNDESTQDNQQLLNSLTAERDAAKKTYTDFAAAILSYDQSSASELNIQPAKEVLKQLNVNPENDLAILKSIDLTLIDIENNITTANTDEPYDRMEQERVKIAIIGEKYLGLSSNENPLWEDFDSLSKRIVNIRLSLLAKHAAEVSQQTWPPEQHEELVTSYVPQPVATAEGKAIQQRLSTMNQQVGCTIQISETWRHPFLSSSHDTALS